MKKQILITGSNGFIGSHLYNHLVKEGYYVRGIDLQNSDYNMDLSDLTDKDKEILEDIIIHSDIVFHLAASVGVDNINIINSYKIDNNLMELFRKYKPKVIYSSSSEVYGKSKKPMKESGKLKLPGIHNGYPVQKLMTENLLKAYKIPHTIIRFFNIIGPGQSAKQGFVIPRFIEASQNDKPIKVYQEKSVRTFMDIRDVLPVLEKLMYRDIDVINIGNPDNTYSILDVANMIKDVSKSDSKIIITDDRKSEIKYRLPDVSKMLQIHIPKYSLKDTIKWIINE